MSGPGRPSTFQGWQRVGCIAGVVLLGVLTVLLVVGMTLGILGIH
ncbi:MAG: hypothetical protein ACYCZN_02820 [Candidatus Dormibacteria bacterium]